MQTEIRETGSKCRVIFATDKLLSNDHLQLITPLTASTLHDSYDGPLK